MLAQPQIESATSRMGDTTYLPSYRNPSYHDLKWPLIKPNFSIYHLQQISLTGWFVTQAACYMPTTALFVRKAARTVRQGPAEPSDFTRQTF